jgi:hypothetical protein
MRNYQHTIAFLLLLAMPISLFAQKLGTKSVTVNYKQRPLSPLPEEIKTYNTMIRSGYILFDNESYLERNYLKVLQGYQHVADDGDLTIMVTFRGLDIVDYNEKHDSKKDGTTFNYRYNVTYTFPMRMEVYQRNGDYVMDLEISDLYKEHKANFGKNNEFANEEALEQAFKERKGDFFVELENRLAKQMLSQARDSLVTHFAYAKKRKRIRIGFGKGKKKDYSDLEKARDLAYRAYSLTDKGQDGLDEFQQAIDLWEKALQESNLSNKKARINQKITRWLHYNLAMAYAWLDDYDSAMKHVVETEIIKHQGLFAASFSASELRAFIEDRQRRYEANL